MTISKDPLARRQFVSSVAHGLTVLEALADHGPDIDLGALARVIKLPKPTTWRLVHTLVSLGYVGQNAVTRRFSLTPRILALGASFEGMDLKELAAPFLRELSDQTGETVNMAVRDGTHLIYIERIKTAQIININLHVGSRLPLYNTSMGRALIAHMPADWLRQYVAGLQSDPAAARYTRRNGSRLLEALTTARQRGYAVNDEELAAGLRSVACPIWDSSDRVVAAINIAVPSARMSLRDLCTRQVPHLVSTAEAISTAVKRLARRTAV